MFISESVQSDLIVYPATSEQMKRPAPVLRMQPSTANIESVQSDPIVCPATSEQMKRPALVLRMQPSTANINSIASCTLSETDVDEHLQSVAPDGFPGYSAIQDLAEYMVGLVSGNGSLTAQQVQQVLDLWKNLSPSDKLRTVLRLDLIRIAAHVLRIQFQLQNLTAIVMLRPWYRGNLPCFQATGLLTGRRLNGCPSS
ncbi:uncharacterized protein LOC127837883 [Dreissena polymorpha]|uniref:uncharacterized protein LOC127837883 n=1 Tax=Dreissena polymorpha TaxID=45954 RepID=UPI002263D847|nr:uncharacterized protein LOC127837883 [Dreissena polymorpha]